MNIRDKFKLIILSIVTLGVYPLVAFRKSNSTPTNVLSHSAKISIDIEKLIRALGGRGNVVNATNTHTKIKFDVISREHIKVDTIGMLKGISGVFATSTTITIIVGNSASEIAKKFNT